MSLVQSLLSTERYGIKCPYQMEPEGVCIHNTANDASAKNEIAYMKSNDNQVSFHIAVDDKEAIQAIPFNRNAWHAGDGGRGTGNRRYIAVEICYSKSVGERFVQAEQRAAREVAAILKGYGWGVERVKAHRDFSAKNCPHRTDMDKFKTMVQEELNKLNGASNPVNTSAGNLYRVRLSWSDAGSQKGAFSDLNNAKKCADDNAGYKVFDKNGQQVYPEQISNNIIGEGAKVRVVGNKYATGQDVPGWVKNETYTVQQVSGNKALLKEIVSWVYINDLALVSASAAPKVTIEVGSKVKVTGSNYATGQAIPGWVKNNTYTVMQLSDNKALLKEIMSWVYIKDLILM
ncbi:hypothetical protein Q428_08610 [Fervidicella metallireducens AeB]|uniref:N-acetylmuramoyl-L-alanine amidase n=1 Tax=Fervidicella metallireducens AeB TaxID=1403537 RepID=A0A017RUF7_9CLOT|nr:N-acetylmuramoyl-L-alanine amidase [Fervidicella metallireducens]EYE88251.1 hypothetical protein Q428_08610 [Fervidicella metallireducens AeB]